MSNEVAVVQSPLDWAVSQCGMSKEELFKSVKVQCFGAVADKIEPFHLDTYFDFARRMNLNPLMPGQMYGFPTKSGQIQIILGPDGLYSTLRNNPDVKIWKTKPNYDNGGNLISATAYIYTRSCEEPFEYTALLSEWRMSSSPVWGQKPTHMLEYRALKQCARYVIGNGLLPDREEAKMADAYEVESEVVTPANTSKTARLTAKMAAAPIVINTLPPVEVQAESVVSPVNVPKREELDLEQPKPKQEDDAKSKAKALWAVAKKEYPELFESLSRLGKQGKQAMHDIWLEESADAVNAQACLDATMEKLSEKALDFLAMACPPDVHKETIQRINASSDKAHASVLEAIAGGW